MGSEITDAAIGGVFLKKLNQIIDNRGALFHFISNEDPKFSGFGEAYISKTNPNVIKGWKMHHKMIQNFCVPQGRFLFTLFDYREDSATKGFLNQFTIDDSINYFRLTIPPNIWYSFKCISDTPGLIFNVTNIKHDPNEVELLPIDEDSIIPFRW